MSNEWKILQEIAEREKMDFVEFLNNYDGTRLLPHHEELIKRLKTRNNRGEKLIFYSAKHGGESWFKKMYEQEKENTQSTEGG